MCVSLIKTGDCVCVCARVCWVSRVREWETSFSPQRATATSSNMIDANINILTFTATLWGSTKNTHGEEREEEKRAIRQSAFTQHHTHTHTTRTSRVEPMSCRGLLIFPAGGRGVETGEQQWSDETGTLFQLHQCLLCFWSSWGDRNISRPLLSGSSDLWPLYYCWMQSQN